MNDSKEDRLNFSTEAFSSSSERGTASSEEWKPSRREFVVMVTVAVVSLMVALDATVLVPVLPRLAEDLNGTSEDAFWAGTSYLLTSAVFQPFVAAASDVFGRRATLFLSIVLFTVGTALCAPIAKDFTVLLCGRSIQGIGGGGVISMGQVIFADIVPLRQRPRYFSIVLASWALGSVLGPLAGGAFVEHLNWKWCFYLNFPFCAAGLVLVPIFVTLKAPKASFTERLSRIDWIGGFLFIGGMTSLLVGISWAGLQYAWDSVQTIAPMAAGIVAICLACVWEWFGASEPMLRPSIFDNVSAIAAYACAFCQGFLLFTGLYYIPFYFESVHLTGPLQSGINLLPVTGVMVPASIVVSGLATRLGRYRWAIWVGWAITIVGTALLHTFDRDTPTAQWAGILAIYGVGNGMVLTSVNVAIQAISRVEDAGRSASMYAFMRSLGMSIGVAAGGNVFQQVMKSKLDDLHLPEAIAENSEAFVFKLQTLRPKDPLREGSITAYVTAFKGVFIVMAGVALFAFFVSTHIGSHSMDKDFSSKLALDDEEKLISSDSTYPQSPCSEADCSDFYDEKSMRSISPTDVTTMTEKLSTSSHLSSSVVAFYITPEGRTPMDFMPSRTEDAHSVQSSNHKSNSGHLGEEDLVFPRPLTPAYQRQ